MAVYPLDKGLHVGRSLAEEFKAFALKGNVIDLAVGVIIGAAFAKIIDSLVKNLLMPLISIIMPSDQSYLGWKVVVDGKELPYGLFIGDVVNFVIVAAALFLFVVKFIGFLTRQKAKQAAAAAPVVPAPTREQELLSEIRDLLQRQARV